MGADALHTDISKIDSNLSLARSRRLDTPALSAISKLIFGAPLGRARRPGHLVAPVE